MVKVLFTFLTMLFCTVLIGQKNHFSNPDSKWYVRNTTIDTSPYQPSFIGVNTMIYGFKGDTIISGKKWLNMYSTADSAFTNNLKLEGYVYSDNEIVEFIDVTGKLDTIYNFSISKNDSIYFTFKYNQRQNQYLKPSSVDSISIGSFLYKKITFNEPTGQTAFDHLGEEWIWGIGSIHGPLHPVYLQTYTTEDGEANESDLVCTHISDTIHYSTNKPCYSYVKNDWKSWYKIGTTWYINDSYNFPNNIEQGFQKFTVKRDTVLDGKTAKVIEGYSHTNIIKSLPTIILYEENKRAYFWNKDSFQLMYDFNLIKGDTLYKIGKGGGCDSAIVVIDSISTLTVGGESLIVQHLNVLSYQNGQQYYDGFPYDIIERVGFAYVWVFGGTLTFDPFPTCVLADNFWHDNGLRCFEEPNGLYYNAKPQLSSCDLITTTNEIDTHQGLIYPNPVQHKLYLNDFYQYQISNINGAVIFSGTGRQVILTSLSSGLYIVTLTNSQGESFSQKFIRE